MNDTRNMKVFFVNKWEIHVNGSPEEVFKDVGTYLRGIVKGVEVLSAVHERVNISQIVEEIMWS